MHLQTIRSSKSFRFIRSLRLIAVEELPSQARANVKFSLMALSRSMQRHFGQQVLLRTEALFRGKNRKPCGWQYHLLAHHSDVVLRLERHAVTAFVLKFHLLIAKIAKHSHAATIHH